MAGFAEGGMYMQLTAAQKKLANRLAEIEEEDAQRCRNCGGEDCACCEIYIDRMRWEDPATLFERMDF